MTLPQIELMQSDLPHTLYRNGKTGKVSEADLSEAERLQEEANRKARERRERHEDDSYTVDELFKGVAEEEHQ